MRCYLFDIDGTIADLSHRLHHIDGAYDAQGMCKPKNWDAFFADIGEDAPIDHIIDLSHALHRVAKIVLVSGRSDQCRDATIAWLQAHDVPFDSLYMRKAGDHRQDNIVKAELLDLILADGFQPIMAFDDRDQVVKMWRERGVPCAQVADGDF